jgi:hypothetical protein
MSGTDALAACDRLTALFERAHALESQERGDRVGDDAIYVPVREFAVAQMRMRIRPALQVGASWPGHDPVQVALLGGTNTGKSTVMNLLIGRAAAGMNALGRFSQHPEGYRTSAIPDRWLDDSPSRFAGYHQYRDQHPPRQADDDLRRNGYRPAFALLDPERLAPPALARPAAPGAVVWDAPDFSTEEGLSHLRTVADLLGLADLVVMPVTGESYADARGNALLKMVGEAGITTIVVPNKLSESRTLLDDITRTLSTVAGSRAPLIRLPQVRAETVNERFVSLVSTPEAQALRHTVERETARGLELKRQALRGAIEWIGRHFDEVLGPLAHEASLADGWARTVERAARERILAPYRRDYLEGVRYGEFNRTLVHLMELLQIPWVGPLVELSGQVVRAPVRLAQRGLRRVLRTPSGDAPRPPEQTVLRDAVLGWLTAVKAEAQAQASARSEDHHREAWRPIVERLDSEAFTTELLAGFDAAYDAYRRQLDEQVKHRAEALYLKLKERPGRLAALRGANLLVSAASVALAVKTYGLDWSDAVLGPAVAGLWRNLVEWGLGRYLETLRTALKEEQARAVAALVASSLEAPVRALYRGTVSADELSAARGDLDLLRAEAARIAEGGGR